jgi:hypothetical protein
LWEPQTPDPASELTQGDLLRDVYFPSVHLPPTVVAPQGSLPGEQGILQVSARRFPAIVVLQDCVIDKPQVRQILLAPISATRPKDDRERAGLLAELPPVDERDTPYTYDLFRCEPFGEHLVEEGGVYRVADLKQITPFGGRDELRALRVGRMTVQAKRLLRIKLGAFFGRTSDEDAEALIALGLPPGLPGRPPRPRSLLGRLKDWLA